MSKKKGLTMFAHPLLLYGGVTYCVFMALSVFVLSLLLYIKDKIDLSVAIIFTVIGLLMIVAMFPCLPRWYVKITFGTDKITFKQAFKKETEYEYRVYQYVYRASYLHMLYRPQFIVFSQTRLKDVELQNINQVAPSEKTIKIRYNKKTFQKLQQVSPPKHRIKFEQCFPEIKVKGEI